MSGVELPLVGSARSSSSGSSRSLNSAGSNSSSTKRLTCDEESEEEEDQDPEETSQGGLWDEVEQFLNKPSPSFGAIAKDTSTISRLPTIPKTEVSKSSNQTKGRGSISKVKKPIDPKLLQEAFAYAAHVQRQSLEDETDEQEQQHRRTNSSGNGILRQDSIRPERKEKEIKIKKKKNSSHSAYGAPLKPTQKKKSFSTGNRPSLTSTSNSTTNSSEWDSFQSSSSSLDPQTLQSLVSNFQNGTTLDELRRELAASQQSIAQSRQVIQDAAKTFFTK